MISTVLLESFNYLKPLLVVFIRLLPQAMVNRPVAIVRDKIR